MFGVTNYTINKNKSRPKRADVLLFGEYQSKVGTAGEDAQKRLSDYIDPEAEWATGRQGQSTLAKFVEEEDAEDVFEADNRMRWFTFTTIYNGDSLPLRISHVFILSHSG